MEALVHILKVNENRCVINFIAGNSGRNDKVLGTQYIPVLLFIFILYAEYPFIFSSPLIGFFVVSP